ncbi:TusE/DsrC/DsvC family sulfur relay protein [Motiliproteus sediminis]|uniref:TusE/DsrC/DsvC family sulfur relay protein n=1 Tax=Motiliproteus sediminis TaxID=1468178 RepID=UPI001AEFC0DA|nr:TusE/DsrC/DsvC family sulfur relay protein [Motiliproteus sediminis]
MEPLHINGQQIALDPEGYLQNLADWSPEVARQLAHAEGIELQDEHWEIIELLRDFYAEYQLSPAMRILVKQTGIRYGKEKGNSMHLLRLFPGSPAKLASKLAGLPKPSNCL